MWKVSAGIFPREILKILLCSGRTRKHALYRSISGAVTEISFVRLGCHFALLKPQDMVLLDKYGNVAGGNRSLPANAAGYLIHRAIHEARPDVHAACHFHSPHGKAWSAFAQPLEMINQDAAIFYGEAQAVYSDFGGIVLRDEESEALARSLGKKGKAMVLRNHGLLTVGSTVDEAAYLFILMERSCQIQLEADVAAASGRNKVFMTDEAAKYTFKMTSDPVSAFTYAASVLELTIH